ncbi:hypothetical protein Taro_006853 [Colocasia esculenta]|uniref:Uncharacterized protein n=1 Tax=Colocasia esculenta TaxID=4460 RepID=A0A843TTJ9_COLES|nr:hypothetical protein [Colocasia esculenta]
MERAAWGGYNRGVTHMGDRTCCSVISRVVPRSRINIPVRKPSAVVRYGRADDLLRDMPLRSLTTSDHRDHTMEVFESP